MYVWQLVISGGARAGNPLSFCSVTSPKLGSSFSLDIDGRTKRRLHHEWRRSGREELGRPLSTHYGQVLPEKGGLGGVIKWGEGKIWWLETFLNSSERPGDPPRGKRSDRCHLVCGHSGIFLPSCGACCSQQLFQVSLPLIKVKLPACFRKVPVDMRAEPNLLLHLWLFIIIIYMLHVISYITLYII